MDPRLPPRLLDLLEADPDAVSLAELALLVAQGEYPHLDISHYLRLIEDIAMSIRQRLGPEADSAEIIVAMNQRLFQELRYGAAGTDYYDPRNSYLNEVMERRRGIPITLSILYIEVGRRLGLPVDGVAFPGHFLVKCDVPDGIVLLDPYHGGVTLDREDLQDRLREGRGEEVSDEALDDMLVSASPRDIVARILRNLKSIHLKAKQMEQALAVLMWLTEVLPGEAAERRDRGLVYQNLECFRAALADYEHYLEHLPDADDADAIRGRVVDMRRAAARLN